MLPRNGAYYLAKQTVLVTFLFARSYLVLVASATCICWTACRLPSSFCDKLYKSTCLSYPTWCSIMCNFCCSFASHCTIGIEIVLIYRWFFFFCTFFISNPYQQERSFVWILLLLDCLLNSFAYSGFGNHVIKLFTSFKFSLEIFMSLKKTITTIIVKQYKSWITISRKKTRRT